MRIYIKLSFKLINTRVNLETSVYLHFLTESSVHLENTEINETWFLFFIYMNLIQMFWKQLN